MNFLTKVLVAALSLVSTLVPAASSTDKMKIHSPEPTVIDRAMGISRQIFLSGHIDADAAQRFIEALSVWQPKDTVRVYVDSPGGNVSAALSLGRRIRAMGAETYIGRYQGTDDYTRIAPGTCTSACALAYLGGQWRFMSKDDRYGVHQLSLREAPKGLGVDAGFAGGQMAAGQVVAYLRKMGVDAALLEQLVAAGRDEMNYVDMATLRRLGVVNNGRAVADWRLEVTDGAVYLRGEQVTQTGTGKITLTCGNGVALLITYYDGGKTTNQMLARGNYVHSLMFGSEVVTVAAMRSKIVGQFLVNGYKANKAILDRFSQAHSSIGHAMQVTRESPTFYGFRVDVESEEDARRIRAYVGNCIKQLQGG